MKANAPEKIYLVIDPVWGSMSVNYNRNDTNNIEYTRTDAFIEKTCDFISSLRRLDDGVIEDFRKYMEGEQVMKANKAPTAYPMQFRDKIDEYLWKEHHILGGCCSSIEEMKYSVAREVAEKLTDAFIEKACEYLMDYEFNDSPTIADRRKRVEEFKNAMKL